MTTLELEENSVSLFDRCDWLYAFMREHCFRDDTRRIDAALWPAGGPPPGAVLLDLGCGPGTYARRLAASHPQLHALGIDRSVRQLARARSIAARHGVRNCTFALGDADQLPLADGGVDAVIASRLLMVLSEPDRAVAEMHRVLRPGGRCFVAEPRSAMRAAVPLAAMQIVTGQTGQGERVGVLDDERLDVLLRSVPWRNVRRHEDRWYRYAVCEKAA